MRLFCMIMRVRGVATTDSFFRFKHLVFLRTHWCVSDVICIVTHTSPLKTNSHVSRFELSNLRLFLYTKSSNTALGIHTCTNTHTHAHTHTHKTQPFVLAHLASSHMWNACSRATWSLWRQPANRRCCQLRDRPIRLIYGSGKVVLAAMVHRASAQLQQAGVEINFFPY